MLFDLGKTKQMQEDAERKTRLEELKAESPVHRAKSLEIILKFCTENCGFNILNPVVLEDKRTGQTCRMVFK